MTTPTDDPILGSEVENAIAPYRSLLPPEALEVLRATIIQAYTEHPAGQRILHHLRAEATSIQESGEVRHLNAKPSATDHLRAVAPAMGRGKVR